jgi:hypothetical protein
MRDPPFPMPPPHPSTPVIVRIPSDDHVALEAIPTCVDDLVLT